MGSSQNASVLVSEAVQSKPEQLCGASMQVLPAGTEKNDIIFSWRM